MSYRRSVDVNGQPPAGLNRRAVHERDIVEFMGLAKGVLSDGIVNQNEADFLFRWLKGHRDAIEGWPLCVLVERVTAICADGIVDVAELDDLAALLRNLVGGTTGLIATENTATQLPVDKPAPPIDWVDKEFVFTGKFAWGPRAACEAATACRGGICQDAVSEQTRYLVIGTFASRDWATSTHGRKIEKAVRLRAKGQQLAILSEDHWASLLPSTPKHHGSTITNDQLTYNMVGLAGEPLSITFWRDGKKLVAECSCAEWTDLIYCRHALDLLDGRGTLDDRYESDAVADLAVLARGSNVAAAKKRARAIWYDW